MLFPYSPDDVREITLKTLMESNYANPKDTVEALIKARPAELQNILDAHHETDAFPTKLMELCSATFLNAASDSAKIALWIYSSDRPDWPAVESNPKKAIREWLDKLDSEDGGNKIDASMTTVSFFKDSIRATIYTNRAEKVLKSSGGNGIYASAAVCEKKLREPYELVKAPAQMTAARMMAACNKKTQGLVRIRDAMYWRAQKEHVDEFRAKLGLASRGPRTRRYEVGPIPTRVLGGSLCAALAAWGWVGARAVCSRSAGQGMTSWLIVAAGPPPARTVVVGGSTVARIMDAQAISQGKQPAAQPSIYAVQPGPQVRPPAPQNTQGSGKGPTRISGERTWAQVVAGGKAAGKAQAKPAALDKGQGKMEKKMEEMDKRMAALEKQIDGEKVAREEQAAKIDAIFAFVQQSAGVAPSPPASGAYARVLSGEPSAKKLKPSRRPSDASGWTQCEDNGTKPEDRKRGRQVTRSAAGKKFAKAMALKRTRRKGDL